MTNDGMSLAKVLTLAIEVGKCPIFHVIIETIGTREEDNVGKYKRGLLGNDVEFGLNRIHPSRSFLMPNLA